MNVESITIRDFPQATMDLLTAAADANGVPKRPEVVVGWVLFEFARMLERGAIKYSVIPAPEPAPARAGSEPSGT